MTVPTAVTDTFNQLTTALGLTVAARANLLAAQQEVALARLDLQTKAHDKAASNGLSGKDDFNDLLEGAGLEPTPQVCEVVFTALMQMPLTEVEPNRYSAIPVNHHPSSALATWTLERRINAPSDDGACGCGDVTRQRALDVLRSYYGSDWNDEYLNEVKPVRCYCENGCSNI